MKSQHRCYRHSEVNIRLELARLLAITCLFFFLLYYFYHTSSHINSWDRTNSQGLFADHTNLGFTADEITNVLIINQKHTN